MSGWCGRGDRPRRFILNPKIMYTDLKFNKSYYDDLRFNALTGEYLSSSSSNRKTPTILSLKQGQLCRISLDKGPMIGHVFLWNSDNPKEHFSLDTTMIFQGTHLSKYARLWSNEPFVRPLATVVADSIPYNTDEDGARLHDIFSSLCGIKTWSLLTGRENGNESCFRTIYKELKNEGCFQSWNIFNCSGISKDTSQYFTKVTPSIKGDYIEFIPDMNLKVTVVCCARGDGSLDIQRNENSLKCDVFAALH